MQQSGFTSEFPPEKQNIATLLEIMQKLRDKNTGCPWDLAQNFTTLLPHTLEEAYEVADAVNKHDFKSLQDELGDLLFHVVFYAQLAAEAGYFTFEDVVRQICQKMIRRHPDIFTEKGQKNREKNTSPEAEQARWRAIKKQEQAEKKQDGLFASLTTALPSLTKAQKILHEASAAGLDRFSVSDMFEKLAEETEELKTELTAVSVSSERLEDELGDILFIVTDLSRKLGVRADTALEQANQKFMRRLLFVERMLKNYGKTLSTASTQEIKELWAEVKNLEKDPL